MNIRDLKYIVEVAKLKSFTKAANAVFVSQPALTMQIKKLEDELKIKIFEREKHEFLVTKTGEKIIKKAEEILKLADEIKIIARNSSDILAGDFKLGAFPTLASYYFPKLAPKISKNFSNLKLYLIEEKTEILIEKLKSGEIDAAFMALPVNETEFEHKKIFSENFYLAVNKNNKLARRKIILKEDLKGKSLLLLEDGHCLRDQALEVCSLMGASEKSDFRASSLETLRQMVAINAGITLIPEIALIPHPEIVYVKIANAPKREIALFWRKSYFKKELIEKILKEIL